ncbi:MAG: transcription-repair coupling factor [Spirochaetaceae bacterium]|nr:MAG: transcription-repair coupling factor [Spirochaetaceae bacterium]
MITLFNKCISDKLRSSNAYRQLVDAIRTAEAPIEVVGPRGSFAALVAGQLQQKLRTQALLVTATEHEAENLVRDLALFGVPAELLPWWQTAPYAPVPANSTVFGLRVRALTRMLSDRQSVTVCPLRAALGFLPPPDYLKSRERTISVGQPLDPLEIGNALARNGYRRVPRVSLRGEYALRGEVLDIFMPGYEHAVRIVFEFDEVEDVRLFDADSQTSVRTLRQAVLTPTREVVWDQDRIERLRQSAASLGFSGASLDTLLDDLATFGAADGEETWYPLAFDQPAAVTDYLDSSALVMFLDSERLVSQEEAVFKEYEALYRERRRESLVPQPRQLLSSLETTLQRAPRRLQFHALSDASTRGISFSYDPPRSYFGNINFFKEELAAYEKAGYTIFIFADTDAQTHRLEHLLADFPVSVVPESISGGFAIPDLRVVVIQENEIFGRRKRVPRSVRHAESAVIDTFVDLSPGDFVVHVNYGIGRFLGIRRIAAGGNERDYIHLEYANSEFIYIPIEQVNLIQRYIGHGGAAPRLDAIGGKGWENRKRKVQKSVEELAERLITLYSKRKRSRGFAFPPDSEWQLDFEASFPYEETVDQLRCIQEVKADMERPLPMDRMICGDVGYGKTEVALRAAFKAVTAGRQAAFLAPTTILVEQHYENLLERVQSFPVRVAMLSRFVTRVEQKRVLAALAGGEVDIVIGTHRLLQKDVLFRELGLLIIDEEQRFGVRDKERLKELRTSVDCLTLTATPIPRTLHMSLLKIRDMSILNTPPHNRRPIETHIESFSEEKVADAVRREIARGGQVFYLHNRVETLDEVQLFLRRLLPEALIECAHGQMSGVHLEDVMHRFVHGAFQVLVSTTIIENGIDIPNVNTIIIDRADMYGIAQLYQLRGRVGRSERAAYAWLFYPDRRALSEIAMKRLQIISDYTELGSGFKIALKDLEVRGAGNLLGRQQSGDILSVGFDLYIKLLDEAIRKLDKAQQEDQPPEVYLELDYTGFIPDSYIDEPTEKMEIYKRIASIGTEAELEAVQGELEDRYGPLPEEVHSLLSLAEIRIICRKLFISSLKERRGHVEIEFSKVALISADKLLRLIERSGGTVRLDPRRPQAVLMETSSVGLKEKSEFIRGRLSSLV